MSIAISVVIGPSKVMRWLLLFIVSCTSVAWLCVLYWYLPRANLIVAGVGLAIAFLVLYVVLRALRYTLRQPMAFGLDVSNIGDVLLRRLDASGRVLESDSVKLRSPLILWSSLLLLLSLQNESGSVTRLLILRDSVSGEGFRRLSLAFHWLAQAQTHTSVQNDLSEGNF
nr:protein YgfX [uncultured Undibacterium sp.]